MSWHLDSKRVFHDCSNGITAECLLWRGHCGGQAEVDSGFVLANQGHRCLVHL